MLRGFEMTEFKKDPKQRAEIIVKHRWKTYQGKGYREPSSGSGYILSCGCSSLLWMSDSLASRMWPCLSDWSTTTEKKNDCSFGDCGKHYLYLITNMLMYLNQIKVCLCSKTHKSKFVGAQGLFLMEYAQQYFLSKQLSGGLPLYVCCRLHKPAN